MSIRKKLDTDAEAILEVWKAGWAAGHPFISQEVTDNVTTMMVEKFIPEGEIYVHETGGKIDGFVAMMGNEIGGLFVKPSSHGKGIGTKLVNHVAPMHETLEVEVFNKNAIGIPFYKKYGFTPIKEYHNDFADQMTTRMQCLRK
eukprot:TRINITY_DN4865_c3_g1_i1.p1 TRINITY_DN4865_c3_g1~~TRINITY_DN4865_c3_g1_i1.p1  ORF type:complete len:157 (+),score=46.20 TRINITY_DN4865_c3_g1_i1:41-472(+)